MTDVTAAGAKLFIGDTEITDPRAEDMTSLEGATYQEVGRVQSLPNVGDSVRTTQFTELGDARVKTIATFFEGNGGDVTVTFTTGDAGQDAMIAALKENRAMKIELDDMPSAGTNPTTLLFVGMNTGNGIQVGDGSSAMTRTFTLVINSETFEKAAA